MARICKALLIFLTATGPLLVEASLDAAESEVDRELLKWTEEFLTMDEEHQRWQKLKSLEAQLSQMFQKPTEHKVSHDRALHALRVGQYMDALRPIWSVADLEKLKAEKKKIQQSIVESSGRGLTYLGQWTKPTLLALEVLSQLAKDSSLKETKRFEIPADEEEL